MVSAPSASRAKIVDSVKTTPSLSEDEKRAVLENIKIIKSADEAQRIFMDNAGTDVGVAAYGKWTELMKQKIAAIKNIDEAQRIFMDNAGTDVGVAAYEKYKQLGGK